MLFLAELLACSPQTVHVGEAPDTDALTLSGQVEHAEFLGEFLRYEICVNEARGVPRKRQLGRACAARAASGLGGSGANEPQLRRGAPTK